MNFGVFWAEGPVRKGEGPVEKGGSGVRDYFDRYCDLAMTVNGTIGVIARSSLLRTTRQSQPI